MFGWYCQSGSIFMLGGDAQYKLNSNDLLILAVLMSVVTWAKTNCLICGSISSINIGIDFKDNAGVCLHANINW